MYIEETRESRLASFTLYSKEFKSQNLVFRHPMKDLYSLCLTFKEGDEKTRRDIQTKYDEHISEKVKVRTVKEEDKNHSLADNKFKSIVFDWQQVIYLAQCQENALFYKRHLANYNFTVYDLATRECS
jgi:hypothetical protein